SSFSCEFVNFFSLPLSVDECHQKGKKIPPLRAHRIRIQEHQSVAHSEGMRYLHKPSEVFSECPQCRFLTQMASNFYHISVSTYPSTPFRTTRDSPCNNGDLSLVHLLLLLLGPWTI